MKSPFPGMDPFLESRWSDVHSTLIACAREVINRLLPPGLVARTEMRTVIATDDDDQRDISPDVSIIERESIAVHPTTATTVAIADQVCVQLPQRAQKQRYLEIRDAGTGGAVVTVIEFISPTNKRSGSGLRKYRQKQQECREGQVNLVEIDLTRRGKRSLIMPVMLLMPQSRTTYQAWVSRATEPEKGWAYCLPLSKRLAAIPIPLRPSDSDVLLDLQPLVDHVYETGRYWVDIDYTEVLEPPLSPADAEWVASLLSQRVSSESQ
jgi:Protein of unknown function (DUF4058)